MKISIVVPAFNEEENISRTTARLVETIDAASLDAEVILVDDGSTDATWDRAREAAAKHGERVRAARLRRNQGKTAAIVRGIEAAGGDAILVFDADMQFDPADIPRMVKELEEGADVVTGWKQGKYQKWLVSSIYNVLSQRLFGLDVHDLNSMKAFRREVVRGMDLRKGWHRYMVALAADRGFEIREIRVRLHPRRFGETKYSAWRIPVGFLDLIAVKFQISFMRKPLLFFGAMGMLLFGSGFLVGVYALYIRFVLGHGYRPLAYLVTLLVLSGLVLFAVGFLAEVMADIKGRVERIEGRLEARDGEGEG